MRLAVISDIHSNLAALEAVVEDLEQVSPDRVMVAGDFLNRGPQPAPVWGLLRERGWPLLRGNHEDYVLAQMEPLPPDHPDANPIWAPARWTARQVPDAGPAIAPLPIATTLEAPDGSPVWVVHASPRRNDEAISMRNTDDELRAMMGENPPPLLICAHIHASLTRQVDDTLIVNVGAVGLPFNGDWRTQYGVFTWAGHRWEVELRAIPYDRDRTRRAFYTDGFLEGGGPLAQLVLHELDTSRPHLGPWVKLFAQEVREGRITIPEAVEQYFQTL